MLGAGLAADLLQAPRRRCRRRRRRRPPTPGPRGRRGRPVPGRRRRRCRCGASRPCSRRLDSPRAATPASAPRRPAINAHRIALVLCTGWLAAAQAAEVPNPAFTRGDSLPAGWILGGEGEWRPIDGDPAIVARGHGRDPSWWRSDPVAFEAGGLYRLRFRARRLEDGAGGTAAAGPAFANRDLGYPDADWRRFSSSFAAPADSYRDRRLRFGQWRLRGAVAFDDVELDRLRAVHRSLGEDLRLGRGERIEAGRYVFDSPQHTPMANISRPLEAHDAGFNTFRWVFGPGQRVVFRHQVGGFLQRQARIRVNLNHHTGGHLLVEVSTGGRMDHPRRGAGGRRRLLRRARLAAAGRRRGRAPARRRRGRGRLPGGRLRVRGPPRRTRPGGAGRHPPAGGERAGGLAPLPGGGPGPGPARPGRHPAPAGPQRRRGGRSRGGSGR